ncbi:MAG: hypothetical protein HFG43_12890 [Lachnospiraceae bacterium]|jgi:hypothetical protein|nr:hypothetical protein [Lachnospiraceae bacterium]MCI9591330.1 hypothetical protein [Lachnospiraceae bacterium]
MMNQIRKGCRKFLYTIGSYRLAEWNLERQLRREVQRMLQEPVKTV